MSDSEVLLEIINVLEEKGLPRDEYQLQQVIDVEALEQLVDSTSLHTNLEVQFSVGEFRVLVSPSDVAVLRVS